MKKYLRSIVEDFPHAAAEGYHVFRWPGVYLAACAYLIRYQPFPMSLPGFGELNSWGEAINVVDNFSLRELRSETVENHLRNLPKAWVVDVGVNVGVTCRWWLSLANELEVVGIDMFQEALDFTSEKIARMGQRDRWHPLCGAVGESDGIVEVRYGDPLEGTSRIDSRLGEKSRKMRVQPLDDIIAAIAPKRIGLLKLDIEGSAGHALRGASETLKKCDYVVVETHSDEETRTSSVALTRAGFQLFRCQGRTMWWHREA
jgi:FkbM family methyltransferase